MLMETIASSTFCLKDIVFRQLPGTMPLMNATSETVTQQGHAVLLPNYILNIACAKMCEINGLIIIIVSTSW